MARWVALIRGINVGAATRLPMADLRAMAEALGATDVRSYIQSGNLVLNSDLDEAALRQGLEAAIERFLGRSVPVVLVPGERWAGYLAANPFPGEAETAPDKVFLVLGDVPPGPAGLAAIEAKATLGERARIAGGALWVHFPEGAGKSRLGSFPAATARNWRTARAIEALLAA